LGDDLRFVSLRSTEECDLSGEPPGTRLKSTTFNGN
jgi:hypothetical protein